MYVFVVAHVSLNFSNVIFLIKINFDKSLFRNNDRFILWCISAKRPQRSIRNISQHFVRRCKWIADTLIRKLHGKPELISRFINAAYFKRNRITSMEKVFIKSYWIIPVNAGSYF